MIAMAALVAAKPSFAMAAEPERVVALGGAVTEIIYALGLEAQIVGLDTTSLYPPRALREKPNVGYLRQLSAEGILSRNPTLVVIAEGAGPPEVLELLAQAGLRIARVAEPPTPEGVIARIEAVGRLLRAGAAAHRLAETTRARFAAVAAMRQHIGKPARVLFLLSLQNGRPTVGGAGTAADAMIGLAGGVNAAADIAGYKAMSEEAIIAAAPDRVLMMSNAGMAMTAEQIFERPAFAATPAGKARAFTAMDGLYLLGFGPRTPDAIRDLMRLLYPSLDAPALPAAPAPP
jgi:iron complex transport system substrate-binding protein